MTHKYVIANIKIPIEITENGEQISHMGRSSIEITPCDELPPEQNIDDVDFTEMIQQLINNEGLKTFDSESASLILASDIEFKSAPLRGAALNSPTVINKWNETTVTKENLKKKAKSKNMSFRRKTGNNHNFTMKH